MEPLSNEELFIKVLEEHKEREITTKLAGYKEKYGLTREEGEDAFMEATYQCLCKTNNGLVIKKTYLGYFLKSLRNTCINIAKRKAFTKNNPLGIKPVKVSDTDKLLQEYIKEDDWPIIHIKRSINPDLFS